MLDLDPGVSLDGRQKFVRPSHPDRVLSLAVVETVLMAWLMDPGAPDWRALYSRPGWMRRAACRGRPADEFVLPHAPSRARARRVCGGCPVREDCLAFALADPDLMGVWGGTTERERDAMRRAVS